MRRLTPGYADEPLSPLYRHLNRGKTIACLDLKSPEGQEILKELLVTADVLVESYRPGVLARLGFDRERILLLNPALVHCAISGFGQTGPYRERAGHDLTYCAVSGALSASGTRRRPVMTFPPIADHAGALQAVNTILAALLARTHTGRGCYLDISLSESLLAWQYPALFEARQGTDPERESLLLNGGAACYQIYTTADQRFVALAALEEKFWRRFCEAVDRREWIDRQFEELPQNELIEDLQQLFGRKSLREWVGLLGSVDCCFEPIPLVSEVTAHPQVRERAVIAGFQPRYPAWINGQPAKHTDEIVLLGQGHRPAWR